MWNWDLLFRVLKNTMDCRYFSEIKYSEFARAINSGIPGERIPIAGTLELTYRCNLRCIHCYCNQNPDDKGRRDKELSATAIFKILDDIAERGCLMLLLTGGEPLLRDDFFEIYIYAKKKGFLITFFTNATLVTPRIADFLKEWPPSKVEVTLYGISKNIYEKTTGVVGSFEQCMSGIKNLINNNIPLSLKTMVSNFNKDEVVKMREFAKGLKVDFRFDPLLHPRIDGSKAPCQYRITPKEAIEFELMNDNRLQGWKKFLDGTGDSKKLDSLYYCGAGRDSFSIDPFGKMSVCSSCLSPSYDLGQDSFAEIWDNFFPVILNGRYNKNFKCRGCEIESFCANCPGYSMLENSNPETIVDYLCEIAHLRKEAFDNIYKGGLDDKEKIFSASG